MRIGEKTLSKGGDILKNALLAYKSKINEAFLNNDEDELKIGLALHIKPGPADGNFKLKADISFVTQKITDSFSDSVDEKQMDLFKDEPTKVCPESENGDEIYVSSCATCKSRRSIIVSNGKEMPKWFNHRDRIPELGKDDLIYFMPCRAWADEEYRSFMDEQVRKAIVYGAEQKIKAEEKPKLKKIAGGKK